MANYAVVKDIKELGDVDVAILCTPTRSVEKYAKEYMAMGVNTVDLSLIHISKAHDTMLLRTLMLNLQE